MRHAQHIKPNETEHDVNHQHLCTHRLRPPRRSPSIWVAPLSEWGLWRGEAATDSPPRQPPSISSRVPRRSPPVFRWALIHTTASSQALARIACVLLTLITIGCDSTNSVYTPQSESQRDPLRAQRLTLQAVDIAPTNLSKAESLLREALASDLFHGPAHNNLGIIFLKRGQLYEAASEFEWARKLLPGHPDPRVNLAMTLEQAGRTDEALATYTTALEVYPNYLPAMQGLARLQIRQGKPDDKTDAYLREIAMRCDTPRWRDWARTQVIKRSSASSLPQPANEAMPQTQR